MRDTDQGSLPDQADGGTPAERIAQVGVLVTTGRSAEAVALAEPLLGELDAEGSRQQRLQVLSWLGPAYVDLHRLDESLTVTSELIELAGDEPSTELASALCLRGVMLVKLRRENQGLADLRRATTLTEPGLLDDEGLFNALAVLASSSANIGLYEASERYCVWGEALAAHASPPALAYQAESWAWLHAEWAVTLWQEGDDEGARRHVERLRELTADVRRAAEELAPPEELGRDVVSVDAATLRALVAAWDGRADDALRILDGLEVRPSTRLGHSPALAAAMARAVAHRVRGDVDATIRHAREVADLASAAGGERWEAEAYRILRDVTPDRGLAGAANERFEALFDGLAWQRRLRPLQLAPRDG